MLFQMCHVQGTLVKETYRDGIEPATERTDVCFK